MEVVVLGTAAGGGFPQWNCGCVNCELARTAGSGVTPRMQSSLAVSADGVRWFLVNASPDVARQIERFLRRGEGRTSARTSPVAGVLLTNADLDHCLGLFALREGAEELTVWAPETVRRAVVAEIGVERVLRSFGGVRWREAEAGWMALGDSGLEVSAVGLRGTDSPRWAEAGKPGEVHAVGYLFREGEGGEVVGVFPDVAVIDEGLVEVLRTCDRVFFDGTFWTGDEMVELGFSDRDAAAMGHVPMSGEGGSLAVLAGLPGKCAYLHVNNTNPVLRTDSEARAVLVNVGVRLAEDGERFLLARDGG